MRESDGDFTYPVPWSVAPATNFIDTAAAYERLLGEAGFSAGKARSRRDFAIEFFRQMRQRMAQGGSHAPGLQIVMGATALQKVANMMGMLERGVFAPTEIISRAA